MTNLSPPPGSRSRRRLGIALAAGTLAALALIAAVPWALSTPPARRWLLARADRALAPAGLDVASWRLSWFRPTRLTGLVVRDRQGDRVLAAPGATWDRNLWQILFDRPRFGTLDLGAAALDVERRADGSVDLAEALRPILTGDPRTDLTVRMAGGSFRLRDPGLAHPAMAGQADLTLRIPVAPRAVSWRLALAKRVRSPETLIVEGQLKRQRTGPAGESDLSVTLAGTRWPLDLQIEGYAASVRLDGTLDLQRRAGLWSSSGSVALLDLDAAGPVLAGDRLRLDRVAASWDVARGTDAWTIRRLELTGALGTLTSSGTLPASRGKSAQVVMDLDAVALTRHLPQALRLPEGLELIQGQAGLRIVARDDGGGPRWDVDVLTREFAWNRRALPFMAEAPTQLSAHIVPVAEGFRVDGRLEVRDPSPPLGPGRGPNRSFAVTAQTLYRADTPRIELSELSLVGPFGTLLASGQLDDPGGRCTLDLRGTAAPDWGMVHRLLTDGAGVGVGAHDEDEPPAPLGLESDPGASGVRFEVEPLTFRIRGPIASGPGFELWKRLEIESSVLLHRATASGIDVGAATISGRSQAGRIALEPIETTLNGGRLRIEPELVLDGPDGPVLRLGSGTAIVDAEVNEELSRRVLAYVAPVLGQATRPRGKVSVAIRRADIPLGAEAARRAVIEGNVEFRDLEFVPGPLGADLLGLVGRQDATLRLDAPVVLEVADGQIRQRGLAIPLGNLSRIELEGSVDFDRKLDLTASLPITSALLGDRPLLADIAEGARVTVPIGGTLAQPRIDRQALRDSMKDLGKSLLTRGAVRGAGELLFRLTRPRDPNAAPLPPPPRPTPEERRAQRLQRNEERRRERQERSGPS
ncbi:MAG TPA: hypothetical protein VF590_03070 [Isosphaeraceae bacterium]